MAIQKMQLVNIMGPVERFDWVVENCIVPFAFEPVQTAASSDAEGIFLLPFTDENPYTATVQTLAHGLEAAGIDPEEAGRYCPEHAPQNEEEITSFCRALDEQAAAIAALEQEKAAKEDLLKQLAPLRSTNIPFDRLTQMKFIDVLPGRMPATSYHKLTAYGSEAKVIFVPAVVEKQVAWGIAFYARSEREKARALLSSLYFRRVEIPAELRGDPDDACRRAEERIAEIELALSEQRRARTRQIGEHRAMLCEAYAYYRRAQEWFDLRKFAHKSDQMFSISGWMRQKNLARLQKTTEINKDILLVAESPRDNPELKPPTRLWNLPVIRFFQMFVEMYGLPSYGEIDPTFPVAVTYILFFGIMFGDLGQGLVLSLIGLFMWFKMKMPLGRIVAVIGVSSAAGGLVFGSVFGLEDVIPGFAVLKGSDPLYILLFAAGIGLVLIGLAMVLNIINGLRARDPGRWLFSPNGAAGFLLFFGNVAAALSLLLLKRNLWSPVYLTCTTYLPLLALFLAAPLTRLMKGEKKWLPAKPGEFFAESFFELFEVLLSYMSNVISYVRIGAFAISHAGMMLVVTGMAEMVSSPAAKVLVMIFGNIFVIGLEGLIVGIQCLRLQFYEFFSRFYTGGGRQFAPVHLEDK